MVEEKNSSQDTVQISGNVALQNVSYEKDVMEIKLADTVDSDNYGGNFVKDVCVDEGAILHRKISEEKPVDKRSSPNFSCQMIPANSDIRYGKKDDSKKYMHELKPEAVVPVDFAPDYDNEKQHSSGKEYDLEDRTTTSCIAGDPSEKISLQELLRLESAEESRHASTINSESSEIHEEAVGQTSKDGFPDAQVALTNTSQPVSSGTSSKENTSGCSGTMSEGHDAASALDVREPHKIDRYNPFIDHRLEDASEPERSIPGITDAASADSICAIDNAVNGSTGLDEVETVEPGTDAVSTSSSDIQSSGKSDDHSGSIFSKAITGAVDETAVATSSSSNTEPSNANGENQEKRVSDGVADQIDEEHRVGSDGAVNKSSTLAQDHSVAEQTASESSKSTARIGNDNPSEPNFFGPSIMSGPLSMSGHIAYSGNVSLRSDSSTTSTRSFAFPVLQREWISSPVRMAKAERRRNRRRRAWRKGLICCKF
ncbi:hypothetical protein SEVIR_1G214900v4 [Setaria viridis]|uniref:Uncharacterized protein n=1 Tax=Setaria viridis TaxID=4556 RepID=A0A4U6WFI1_SETVI|nr:uncharacterized protein LOC117863444 isoform X1 [Setaria viridis]TKW39969.1 hypothetical protein SEVIR_1G214900v2 [Setaria viridis]